MEQAAVHISRVATPKKQQPFFGKKKEPAFFAPALIQPKLTIAPVNDPYETEADAVADKVMLQAKPSPLTIQRKCDACEAEEKLHRKEDEEDSMQPLQMKPAADFSIQRKCDACGEEHEIHRMANDEEEPVQLKAINSLVVQRQCAECAKEEDVYRAEASPAPAATPAVTPAVHSALKSQGRPLDAGTKHFMESRFGQDFSDVQIHNDSLAHQSSKEIKAKAYTHGQHIVFGEGQYQPETYAGKQLLAHELTHIVQQNGTVSRKPDDSTIHRDGFEDYLVPPGYGIPKYNDKMIEVDIRGQKDLQLPGYLNSYLLSYFVNGADAPIKIKYGDLGSGLIYIKCPVPGFKQVCERDPDYLPFVVLYLLSETCYDQFDATSSLYSATRQVIPISLPHLDTSTKPGTIVLNVEINNSEITGKIGWLANVSSTLVDPFMSYDSTVFSNSALLPFIYGNDYKGDNFKEDYYRNGLKDGVLNILSLGELSLPNLQKIQGIFQTGDGDQIWNTNLVTNIMGAAEYQLPINRTDQGFLSGESDELTLSGEWTGKGFKAKAALRTSFINSNLFVIGEVNYKSDRGEGNLFLAVTDYLTAKSYAIEYLPKEIGALAATDKQPDNSGERLAFVGAGSISLILFNGEKNSAPAQKAKDGDIKEAGTGQGTIPPARVDASFVVEPEGFITVAGAISQPTAKYPLFDRAEYAKELDLFKIPVIEIFGPYASRLEVNIGASLQFGAHLGPLTLSQLMVSGIYSNRPEKIRELELSGFLQLDGGIFANLVLSIGIDVGWGPFSVEVFSKTITFGAEMKGSIYARPTIKIRSSDTDITKPREYSIAGNFDFDVGGGLSYQIEDRVKANAKETKPQKPGDPKTYKYIEGKDEKKRKVPEGDIKIPVDESLGAEMPPPAISAEKLEKLGFGTTLKQVMTAHRPDNKYFEEGVSDAYDPTEKTSETKIKQGGYRENGEKRGDTKEPVKTPPAGPDMPENPIYTFEKGFHMKSAAHKLYLLVEMVRKGYTVSNVVVNLLMASEVAEDIEQKIDQEEAQIAAAPGPAADFQEKDLEAIRKKAGEIEKDITEKAKHNQVTDDTLVPQLAPLAAAVEDYGMRNGEPDLGTKKPAPPASPAKKVCVEPTNVKPGDDIVFIDTHNEDLENGVVQAIYVHQDDQQRDNWLIKFKPKTARSTTNHSKPAYDENCDPTYRIPVKKNTYKPHIKSTRITVPTRYVDGQSYYGIEKASTITAYPLRWGAYLDPKVNIVGIDRISPLRSKWHRAHLVDGDLGGPGRYDNLVPASPYVNTVKMTKHEDHLEGLVKKGDLDVNKVYYWFSAVVNYYDDGDNVNIKHFSDFVESVDVSYGVAEPKDKMKAIDELTENEWELKKLGKYEQSVDFDDEPETLDIKSTRTEG